MVTAKAKHLIRHSLTAWTCLLAILASHAALAAPRPDRIPPRAGEPQQITSPDQTPQGLEKSDWQSIRAAHRAWEHSFMPVEGGWQARNPGQQWITQFDGRGFLARPKAAGWQWGLELRSYGFGDKQQTVGGKPEVKAEGQRLTYQWDADVQEWYVNDQSGLEHGFTVAQRPASAEPGAELDFVLGTRGTLKTSVAADAQTVYFRDGAGAPVVTYAGLKVWDADGQVLPSRFVPGPDGGLILRVEESAARYPLTIDPIAQQAYVKPSLESLGYGGVRNNFGYSVAVSGDTVVVGAPLPTGAAYVFVRSNGTWSQQAQLRAHQITDNDWFGHSVAVSGDTLVVGAYAEDSSSAGVDSTPDEGANSAGAAYVFVRSGTTWSQQAYLKAHQVTAGDWFGWSVAVSGDTVVVGAFEDSSSTGINSTPNEGANSAGAAYVFVRNGSTWTQQAYLKAHQVTMDDYFGYSVAVSGDTVVVGASREDSSSSGINSTPDEGASNAGAAYVFVRSGGIWSQQAYLKAHQVTSGDSFGYSVAVSGDTAVVGAHAEDSSSTGINSTPDEGATNAGAAYVFVRSGTTWSQQAYLKAHQVTWDDWFGSSVAVSDDTVVVGAYREASSSMGINSTPNEEASFAGAAYVFVRSGSTWSQQAYLKAQQVTAGDRFGWSVAVSGDTVVVGAHEEDGSKPGINGAPDEGATGAGAAFAFVRTAGTWSQQAYMKPALESLAFAGADDGFGISVAVSGDTVVVGASGEDSSSTGINSTPDEGASNAGAAYVFVRSGGIWSQQAYLKAHQVTSGDQFGRSVAVGVGTVVVGAYGEDSSSTGINSTPNEGAGSAGAAYVFVRSGGNWSQQAYLKAHQVTKSDYFGYSVAVSGDTVVVGAYFEDGSAGINGTPNEVASDSGAAYVFVRSGGSWSQQAYLKAHQLSYNDVFGYSVAVSGDTVVVGAYGEDSSSTGINSTPNEGAEYAGAAYVFVRSGTIWSQQAYLKAHQVTEEDFFGYSVAVSGDTVVVGAYFEDSGSTGINSTPDEGATNAGAAYVFVRTGSTWSQQAYLKAHQVTSYDWFGRSVAVSGDTVVVGADGENSSSSGINSTPDEAAINAGAAYVFVRTGSTWEQQAYLKAHQSGQNDWFGYSVAASDDTVVVGAYGENGLSTGINNPITGFAVDAGATYIFTGLGPVPAPTVTNVTPASGPTTGGTVVTLTGTAFNEATSVTFDGAAATSFTVDSETQITATTPVGDAGTASVVVTTPRGINAANSLFTYDGPEMEVTGNGFSVTDGADAPLMYAHTDFGIVLETGGTLVHTFTLQNTGTTPLNLTGTPKVVVGGTHAADFTVISQPAYPLGAGSSTTFQVSFDPGGLGLRSATLSIANDDSNENPYDFAIQGTGDIYTPQQKFDTAMTAVSLSGPDAQPTAAPKKDGVANLLKYAFNMDLTAPDLRTLSPGGTAGLPSITQMPGILRIEYLRRIGSGLIYTPQKRSALDAGTWQPLTSLPVVTPVLNEPDWERAVHEEPFNPATTLRLYGRVEVTLP